VISSFSPSGISGVGRGLEREIEIYRINSTSGGDYQVAYLSFCSYVDHDSVGVTHDKDFDVLAIDLSCCLLCAYYL
jgi:hypothetical protein